MGLTDLVKGFQVGYKYFGKENLSKTSATFEGKKIVLKGPMEEELMQMVNEGSKFEKMGFYTAMVVKHPLIVYDEVKSYLHNS